MVSTVQRTHVVAAWRPAPLFSPKFPFARVAPISVDYTPASLSRPGRSGNQQVYPLSNLSLIIIFILENVNTCTIQLAGLPSGNRRGLAVLNINMAEGCHLSSGAGDLQPQLGVCSGDRGTPSITLSARLSSTYISIWKQSQATNPSLFGTNILLIGHSDRRTDAAARWADIDVKMTSRAAPQQIYDQNITATY